MKQALKKKQISDTRERLIQAAMELFWEKGYAATGIAELLERTRANSGSFYYFFKGKEDLLLAVLDQYLENLHPALVEPACRGIADPIERIFALLARYRALVLQTDCTYGCPIGRLALEISPDQREVHRKIAANFDGWCEAVRHCLEQAGPGLPAEVDRRKLAHFVLAVMEGGVMQSRSHRSIEPFDDSVAQLRDYFTRLLAAVATETPGKGAPPEPSV